jgi:hypothetical protein
MTKVKELVPEVEPQKVERVLGADIETATLEELNAKFDEVQKELEEKKYDVTLSSDCLDLINIKILPKVEWVGQQAWDMSESVKIISELKADTTSACTQASIRALFQFVVGHKFVGTEDINEVKDILIGLGTIIQQEIEVDLQLLRDAGFELQAAEQGITPEVAITAAMQAENASADLDSPE